MDIMIYIGLLLIGGLLNFIWEPGTKVVHCLAKVYLILAIYLAPAVWIYYFAGIKNEFLLKSLGILMQYGGYLAHLMLGYLAGNILTRLHGRDAGANDELRSIINLTLWAISVSTANSFIVATVGKSTNMPYMTDFIKQSGYAIWFLYFIMAAESLGGIGVLLHFKLRTGPLAACGLILIMIGAVYTHWHNHNPFSDSYAAVSQLISLAMILIIYYFEKQVNCKPGDTQIYVV